MKKVLGLDIGVASIGWAMVTLSDDNKQNKILRLGSRIIPISADENNEFTRGNEQTTNANRRIKRGIRRNLQRYKLRKDYLLKALVSAGVPIKRELFNLDKLDLYELRAKAVNEKVSLDEFGRLLFLLNQKRGYKSNRKANSEDEKVSTTDNSKSKEVIENEETTTKKRKKGYLELIADRENILKENNLTIGQYIYRELKEDSQFRIKSKIFLRSSYQWEFDLIWEKQKEFYPDVLTQDRYNVIRNRVIYYQRPLKSQKALVSECRFEKYHKCIPKTSPLFQVFRLWQEINNIKIISFKAFKGTETDPRFGKDRQRELTYEEKLKLFEVANEKEKLSKKDALALLGYKALFDHYGWNLKKDLEGNKTIFLIRKVSESNGIDYQRIIDFKLTGKSTEKEIVDSHTGEIRDQIILDGSFEVQPLYQLWHLLYSVDDPTVLHKILKNKFQLSDSQAKALETLDFCKPGYGALSSRAIRRILPYMMEGKQFDKACSLAGYNHSDSITKQENEERQLSEKLEQIKKGSLRNPIVEKILSHTINLINAILEDPELGRPDEIRVELARELTQNAEQREKTFKRNNETDRYHREIEKKLKEELGFTRVSRSDIERYKLWEEFSQLSPYEPARNGGTTKPINLSDVFNGSYDIDHIIPRSRVFDDSFQNKILCPRQVNLDKGQMTAYDYMSSLGEDTLKAYVEFITQFYKSGKITKAKFNRLMMPANEIPDDFINRQLNETQYISREVKNRLSAICRNVYSTSGSITDYQRHHWGYDQITQKLNWERFEPAGLVSIEVAENGQRIPRIENWSKREDQRHHAIDALVIASTRQGTIQRLNNLNQIVEQKADQNLRSALLESDLLGVKEFVSSQSPFTEQEVLNAVSNILVSYKTGKRVAILNRNKYKFKKGNKPVQQTLTPRGFLHKEKVYGKIREVEKVLINTRFGSFANVVHKKTRDFLETWIMENENDPKKAFSSKVLQEMLAKINELKIPGISGQDNKFFVDCYKDTFVLRYPLSSIKAKHIPDIIDPVVREIIRTRIEVMGEKEAFRDLEGNPVWFDKEKGIKIQNVRMNSGYTELVPLHQAANGITAPISSYMEDAKKVDYVSTRNNHHIALYRNQEGKIVESVVTFWDALTRKRYGIPVIIKNPASVLDYVIEKNIEEENLLNNLPHQSWQYLTSLQQNEMFVHGLKKEEIIELIQGGDYSEISKHLFRVQKITSKDYFFRLHVETKVDDISLLGIKTTKFIRIGNLEKFDFVKVKINNLGLIIQIGEL